MNRARLSVTSLAGSAVVGLLAAGGLWVMGPGSTRYAFLPGSLFAFSLTVTLAAVVLLAMKARAGRGAEATLRGILEASNDAVLVVDHSGRVELANDQAETLFGYGRGELLGRTVRELLPSPEISALSSRPGQRKDGGTVNLAVSAADLWEPGAPASVLVVRDLTRVRQAEQVLRTREAHLRLIVEQMPAVLWTTDTRLRITSTLGAGLTALELPPEELIGLSMRRCLDQTGANAGPLEGQSLGCEVEWKGRTFQVRVEPLRDRRKRIAGTIGLVLDVSERRRLEEDLRQAQKMEAVGRLAGGIAHDFNNLLCVITGYTELLLLSLEADDPHRVQVMEVKKAADRAATLTRQLLAFSRKQMLTPSVLNLNALVGDLGTMLGRLIGADVELRTELEPALHPVRADAGQIEQILMNLCVNARDAMPCGGTLTLCTRNAELTPEQSRACPEVRPGPHALLEVRDTGCGMEDEVKAHLFEPFFTTKELGKGTGLGLAMVYGIVKQSGGHVEVDSTPGKGTIFRIYLPRTQEVNLTAVSARWPVASEATNR